MYRSGRIIIEGNFKLEDKMNRENQSCHYYVQLSETPGVNKDSAIKRVYIQWISFFKQFILDIIKENIRYLEEW